MAIGLRGWPGATLWGFLHAGAGFVGLAFLAGAGCGPRAVVPVGAAPEATVTPSLSPFAHVVQAREFPRGLSRAQLRKRIIVDVRERLMSHRDIERDAARMVNEIAPIVEDAVRQPEVLPGLEAFAADSDTTVEEARKRWAQLQIADIMLESGGDPDALSSAAAAGAAQWLAGTARGAGLPVDLRASNQLTARITATRCRIAWIEYLRRPDARPDAPGAPASALPDAALLPSLNSELETLRENRRRVDARYDPRRAIFAQTRYLLRIYAKFPSPDWLFQAYHGGEAGAAKTLRLYLGKSWPGTVDAAIRTGADGAPLTFDTLYFTTSPGFHAEAFSYLYGRSDDHRHYWYKLLAAEQVLEVYRKSPEAFHKEWESNLPGRRIEAYWYPEAAAETIPNLQALKNRAGLATVLDQPGLVVRPAQDDPVNSGSYQVLRPAAKGALLEIVAAFRRNGGMNSLETGDLTLTQEYVDRARVLHPPKPPRPPIFPPDPDADQCIGGGPARRFDYHTVGLVFDIFRPKDERDRKILAYTFDRLEALGLLSAIEAKDRDERRFHIVPHPRYTDLYARLAEGKSGFPKAR